jgi:hypothetical protein
VRGLAGVLFEDAPLALNRDDAGIAQLAPITLLVWEEDGLQFFLIAGSLKGSELLRIADSLGECLNVCASHPLSLCERMSAQVA